MRYFILVVLLASLAVSGCYMVEYRYDTCYDEYGTPYQRPYATVRYYSPLEPIVDLAILGAVLHGWGHGGYHYAPSGYRLRR
jgi:hypothetical protein